MHTDRNGGDAIPDFYAYSTALYRHTNLEDALVAIAKAGFRSVELWAERAHLDPRLKPDVAKVRQLLGDLGLRPHSIHCPWEGLRLGHPQADEKQWMSVLSDALAIGAEVGAGLAVVHVTSDSKQMDDTMYEASRAIMVPFIAELAQVATRLGIRLALENLPLMPWLQRRFAASLQELAAAFPSENIGFCLDTGHALINRMSQAAEIQAAGHRLISIHADSNDATKDYHWPPSQGLLDWTDVQRHLTRVGFSGRCVLEVLSLRDGPTTHEAVLSASAAFARAQSR